MILPEEAATDPIYPIVIYWAWREGFSNPSMWCVQGRPQEKDVTCYPPANLKKDGERLHFRHARPGRLQLGNLSMNPFLCTPIIPLYKLYPQYIQFLLQVAHCQRISRRNLTSSTSPCPHSNGTSVHIPTSSPADSATPWIWLGRTRYVSFIVNYGN